jgi:hypothetical protein
MNSFKMIIRIAPGASTSSPGTSLIEGGLFRYAVHLSNFSRRSDNSRVWQVINDQGNLRPTGIFVVKLPYDKDSTSGKKHELSPWQKPLKARLKRGTPGRL